MYMALAERFDATGEYTRNFESWFDEQNAVKPRPPIPQDRLTSRIPSTWITSSSAKPTTERATSTRPTLRTLPPTLRTAQPREQFQPREQAQQTSATFQSPVAATTPKPLATRRTTTQAPETVKTNPPTPRPTLAPFTEPLTFATAPPTTTTRAALTEAPTLVQAPQKRFEPPTLNTLLEPPPVVIFQEESTASPEIFQEPPLVIRTQPPVVVTQPTPPIRFEAPSTFAAPRVQTERPQTRVRTEPPQTRPTVRARPPSTVFFTPPATVRSQLLPEPNRPVSIETIFAYDLLHSVSSHLATSPAERSTKLPARRSDRQLFCAERKRTVPKIARPNHQHDRTGCQQCSASGSVDDWSLHGCAIIDLRSTSLDVNVTIIFLRVG